MDTRRISFTALLCCFPLAGITGQRTNLMTPAPPLAHCGEIESPPFANSTDAGSRICPTAIAREYSHHNKGIGFEILDSESQACFVPDQAYRVLDEIVDSVRGSVKYDATLSKPAAELEQARAISARISHELTSHGFALYIPTDTLGDALVERNQKGKPERHVFDCDTGSFIFMTVAESLGAHTALVDITLPSGNGHNYVQWLLDRKGTAMNWDTNQQGECRTPDNLPAYEGNPMTPKQSQGYAISLRAPLWAAKGSFNNALNDLRDSKRLYPEAPGGYNNFAWMVATKPVPDRQKLIPEAMSDAQKAVSLGRDGNRLDTLACVYALQGDFDRAIATEEEAMRLGGSTEFELRLSHFNSKQDCTGDK